MTKKSSFFLAVLFIANPFVLLFYQNCSVLPQSQAQKPLTPPEPVVEKVLVSETLGQPRVPAEEN